MTSIPEDMSRLEGFLFNPTNPEIEVKPKGWRRFLDMAVPFKTEDRTVLYGKETFKRIQRIRFGERLFDIASIAMPVVGSHFVTKWANLSLWSKQAVLAEAGEATSIFGKPPTNLEYRKPVYTDYSDGCPCPGRYGVHKGSDFYYFTERVGVMFRRRQALYLSGLFLSGFVGIGLFYLKRRITKLFENDVLDNLDTRIANLRNQILRKNLSQEDLTKMREKADSFEALYADLRPRITDVLFNPHLLGRGETVEYPLSLHAESEIIKLNGEIEKQNSELERVEREYKEKLETASSGLNNGSSLSESIDRLAQEKQLLDTEYGPVKADITKEIENLQNKLSMYEQMIQMVQTVKKSRERNQVTIADLDTLSLMREQEIQMSELMDKMKEGTIPTELYQSIRSLDDTINQRVAKEEL